MKNFEEKILVIAHDSSKGGANTSLFLFLKYTKFKNNILLLSPSSGNLTEEIKKIDINYHVIDKRLIFFKNIFLNRIFNIFYKFAYSYKFIKFVRNKFSYAYLNTIRCTTELILLKLFTKNKIIVHFRGLETNIKTSYIRLFFNILLPDRIITLSNIEKKTILEIAKKYKFNLMNIKNKIFVVPNGIELNGDFGKENSKRDSFIVAGIGAIYKTKGVDIFCEVANELYKSCNQKFKFKWYGEVFDKKYFENISSKYEFIINNGFLEFCDHKKNIIQELKYVDFLLITSYSEGFPRILLEAMLTKTFVISSNVGAVPEVLQDGEYGIVINYQQNYNNIIKDFRDTLLNFSSDIVKKNNIIEKAFNKVNNDYEITKIIKKINDIILI